VRTALLVRVLGQGRGQGALEGGPPHMKNCLRTFRKRVGREGPGRTGRRAAAREATFPRVSATGLHTAWGRNRTPSENAEFRGSLLGGG
jgi:hypothetical protein